MTLAEREVECERAEAAARATLMRNVMHAQVTASTDLRERAAWETLREAVALREQADFQLWWAEQDLYAMGVALDRVQRFKRAAYTVATLHAEDDRA
jgi:hypothetical protein